MVFLLSKKIFKQECREYLPQILNVSALALQSTSVMLYIVYSLLFTNVYHTLYDILVILKHIFIILVLPFIFYSSLN